MEKLWRAEKFLFVAYDNKPQVHKFVTNPQIVL